MEWSGEGIGVFRSVPFCPLVSPVVRVRQVGLPDVRFHDVRHSVATILLAAKIDLKIVSELLDHSSVVITADIYAHVLPEQQQEVVDKMGDLFKRF